MKLADTAVSLATLIMLASCRTQRPLPERLDDPTPRAAEVRAGQEPGALAAPAERRVRRREERRVEDERVEAARKPFVEPLLPVKGPLQLPFDPAAPPTMLDLVRAYEHLTDMRFVMRPGALDPLKTTLVGVEGPLDVPVQEVQSTFETMIANQGLALSIVHSGQPFLLSVDSGLVDRALQRATPVDLGDLDSFEKHPALMIATVMPLESLKGGEVAESMRAFVGILASPPFYAVPSPHAVLLSGKARDVRTWVEWLHAMDRAATVHAESSHPEVAR